MQETKREQYIDIARGIAMICIVLGHLGNSTINRIVFTFHVPIFYFITGYFTRDNGSGVSFVKRKAKTLLIPYLLTCLAVIVFATMFEIISDGNVTKTVLEWCYAAVYGAGDSYTDPFYIKKIGAIWFLWASFWGSIVLYFSLKMRPGARVITIITAFAVGYFSRVWFWFPCSIQAGLCAALFMYVGYEMKCNSDTLKNLTAESKAVITLLAIAVWFSFIKNFTSFWLVHCDIGRGVIDIIGCICACHCVVLISRFIDRKIPQYISGGLAYLGRYSILMLCVHLVELDTFPWKKLLQSLYAIGFPEEYRLIYLIVGKLSFIIISVFILSRIKWVRKAFSLK